MWLLDIKIFGKFVIEGLFFKKSIREGKELRLRGFVFIKFGRLGWGGNMEVGV